MRKRTKAKLILNKTTLRNLQPDELRGEGGAYPTFMCYTFVGSCNSFLYPQGCLCPPDE